MTEETTTISTACKKSVVLMSKMARAHSQEIPLKFKKACNSFIQHLGKTKEDFDDVSTDFPQAYLKKIAKCIFQISLSPYTYGSKQSRNVILSLLNALLSSTLMEQSQEVCAQLFLKNSSSKGKSNDVQHSIQLIRMGCTMVSSWKKSKTQDTITAVTSCQTTVLTQLLENISTLQDSSSSSLAMQGYTSTAFTKAIQSSSNAIKEEIWRLMEETPNRRFAGVYALMILGGKATKARGMALFVSHVLEGPGALSNATVQAFVPLYKLFESSDMTTTFGNALSVALKRRQETIVPVLSTVLASMPKSVDLSSSCHALLFDPILEYWRKKSDGMMGDGDLARMTSVS